MIYRICPTRPLVIERSIEPNAARWYFYMVTDSPYEAKRIIRILNEELAEYRDIEQALLLAGSHD
jgi:hypothetical protein